MIKEVKDFDFVVDEDWEQRYRKVTSAERLGGVGAKESASHMTLELAS